jgi:hypothetical protein
MSIQPGLKRWILIGAVLLAAAGTTVAGIQGTGFRLFAVIGTVETGSDGLQINGVPYDTAHAHVTINGRAGDVSELRAGHIVAAHGSGPAHGAAAAADDIVLESDVRGEITSVDQAQASFSVLGQTVRLDDQSVLDSRIQPNDVSGLNRGTWVKVSAYQRADGIFVASRVDLDLAPDQLQVRGVVQALDRQHQTLRVGELTVDYSGVKTQGAIAEGAIVLARGIQPQSGGPLFASSLEVFSGVGRAGEHGDVRGIVTAFASAADFEINGQPVQADSKTVYVLHGQSLGPDLEVRVTGRFDSNGVLVAQKVQADAPGKAQRGAATGK